jgi:hypothetical protein
VRATWGPVAHYMTWALGPDADARHLANKCYKQRKPNARALRYATLQTGFRRIPTCVVRGISLFDRARYKLLQVAHEDANIGRRRFLLVQFRRSFCSILGLINRLNLHAVRESYLVRRSYGGDECKSRSRKVINKTRAY